MKIKSSILFIVALLICSTICFAFEQIPEKNQKVKSIVVGAENTKDYLDFLKGKRVGVMTNPSGIVRDFELNETIPLVDFLINQSIEVTKIFAPEHGFRGTADAGELIKDGKDIKTGLPVFSLYGKNKKPTKLHMQDLDVMVFDLQDVGVRFYTYISSLHYLMEVCANEKIPLVVFDRPNPMGAVIDGPVLDMNFKSFVGMHPVPVLHGLTIGEYAQMINGEGWLANKVKCQLKIIPCLNYNKKLWYSLPVKPSPNLPNDLSIQLYASLCLFEGTNVSMGRGTNLQFQIYGSPFIKKTTFNFTPMPNLGAKNPKHKGVICYGENLSEIEINRSFRLEWLIKAFKNTDANHQKKFFTPFFDTLAGGTTLREQLQSGKSEEQIRASWKKDLANYIKISSKYQLYKE